jgi:hypothetical protein
LFCANQINNAFGFYAHNLAGRTRRAMPESGSFAEKGDKTKAATGDFSLATA